MTFKKKYSFCGQLAKVFIVTNSNAYLILHSIDLIHSYDPFYQISVKCKCCMQMRCTQVPCRGWAGGCSNVAARSVAYCWLWLATGRARRLGPALISRPRPSLPRLPRHCSQLWCHLPAQNPQWHKPRAAACIASITGENL